MRACFSKSAFAPVSKKHGTPSWRAEPKPSKKCRKGGRHGQRSIFYDRGCIADRRNTHLFETSLLSFDQLVPPIQCFAIRPARCSFRAQSAERKTRGGEKSDRNEHMRL